MADRYSKADVRRVAELLNKEAGAEIIKRIEFNSPGDRKGTRVEIQFNGAPSSNFLGCRDAAHALHAARNALWSLRSQNVQVDRAI
jgi:hypothetical protein